MPVELTSPFKIAFRAEGTMVNAYLRPNFPVPPGEDASLLIGSISRNACDANRQLFERFKELMAGVMITSCKDALGVEPHSFQEQPAPESERGGNA